MIRRLALALITLSFLTAPAIGGELYKVKVNNEQEAKLLREAGVEAVARIRGGFLILAETGAVTDLSASKLQMEYVASGIDKKDMAIDLRLDDYNAGRFPLLYEEDDFRLFRIDRTWPLSALEAQSLMPVKEEPLRIEYIPSRSEDILKAGRVDGLQELIDMINQDSLQAYTERLQAFQTRLVGTDSNYASALWIAGKFDEFGYDSVLVDTFNASYWEMYNVLAYKLGTHLPEHHVIIGAHRDAVSGSPGADDDGSGTAAVLEMARVLKDIETDLTFIFILFDGEEEGLYGSWEYAGDAADRGDSIIFMLNLDMIAHYENSNQAKLYHGTETGYSELWQELADSLVGISGALMGSSGGSDHAPFANYGYQVTFVHEYIFSSVYHSYQDSTTYMNFEYMKRMVQASLATAYSASQTYIPGPSLTFSYPGGIPEVLAPDQQTMFEITVDGFYGGVMVPGTGQIHYSVNDGPVQSDALVLVSGNSYTASLPGLSCGDYLTFYISAEEVTSGIVYDPDPGQPYFAFPATSEGVVFQDDFESDLGWIISGGLWERGTPTGQGGEYGGPDPTSGYRSPSVFGYNLDGDYANYMPARHITSPVLDCSGLSGVKMSFWRWLGVEQPTYDHAYIRVSNDAVYWTTVWENMAEVTDYDWQYMEFDISEIADNQSTVYLRWTMGPTDGGWVYCGWNIDDVKVWGYDCDQGPAPLEITTESLPDWTAGYAFAEQLIASGGVGSYTWSDRYGDLPGTGLSLSSGGLLSGVPAPVGTISFTAEVTDEESGAAEKLFEFNINDSLKIMTSQLPSIIVGYPYSAQLAHSGGTGPITWSDRDDDLSETGLELATDGSMTGTPTNPGTISFIARVEDGVGCSDEGLLSIEVLPPYVCGDTNNDDDVNVADAVFIINYVFKEGPAPNPLCAGDANGDGDCNVADAVYLIAYVFSGGPPPVEDCCL